MKLIEVLKECKKLTGKSIPQLAEEIKMHKTTLYDYINGKSQPAYLIKKGLITFLKEKYGIIVDDESESE